MDEWGPDDTDFIVTNDDNRLADGLDGQLDEIRCWLEILEQEKWESGHRSDAIRGELYEAICRVQARTGLEVAICSCGDAYYVKHGCRCGSPWPDPFAAEEYLASVLELATPERKGRRTKRKGNVIFVENWGDRLADNGSTDT